MGTVGRSAGFVSPCLNKVWGKNVSGDACPLGGGGISTGTIDAADDEGAVAMKVDHPPCGGFGDILIALEDIANGEFGWWAGIGSVMEIKTTAGSLTVGGRLGVSSAQWELIADSLGPVVIRSILADDTVIARITGQRGDSQFVFGSGPAWQKPANTVWFVTGFTLDLDAPGPGGAAIS